MLRHVGYPRSGFVFFPDGFAQDSIPSLVSMIPDRFQQALSITILTLVIGYSVLVKNAIDCKKMVKNVVDITQTCRDSPASLFFFVFWWFLIELDELYPMEIFTAWFQAFSSP